MPLTRRYDPTPAGLAALEPRPMTPAEVADLVRRVRAEDRKIWGHLGPPRGGGGRGKAHLDAIRVRVG
jgi:hypothetical protein